MSSERPHIVLIMTDLIVRLRGRVEALFESNSGQLSRALTVAPSFCGNPQVRYVCNCGTTSVEPNPLLALQ